MVPKTVQHLWLEQKIPQLEFSIVGAQERGETEVLEHYKSALTALQNELSAANARYEKAVVLEKQIEERRNW